MTAETKAPLPTISMTRELMDSAFVVLHDFLCTNGGSFKTGTEPEWHVAFQVLRLGVNQRDAHIEAQAAEIERLRGAAEIALGHMTGGLDGNYADCDPVQTLREAIAPKQPEPCKTCGGKGLAQYRDGKPPRTCHVCNGTGKAGG